MDARIKQVTDWLHAAPSERSITIRPREGIEGGLEFRFVDENVGEALVGAVAEEGDSPDDLLDAFAKGVKLFGMMP